MMQLPAHFKPVGAWVSERVERVREWWPIDQIDIRWVTAGVMVILILVLGWARLFPGPRAIRVGNVVARAVSVGYVSPRPMRGCVVGLGLKWLPDVVLECSDARARVHLVEVGGLAPETPYRFAIVHLGGISWRQVPRVTTTSIYHGNLRTPQPAYGTVVDEVGERVPRALVYVYTQTPKSVAQHPVAALTNEQGNYAVDLANLQPYGRSYVIRVTADDGRSRLSETDIRVTTPFPTIQVPGFGSGRSLSLVENVRRWLP